ncbi:MAG TPA: hypothetical protein VF049_00095 [Nocardioidaceae bacterium]
MSGEYLPPLVAKLTGDISGLEKAFAEAEVLVDKFSATVQAKSTTSAKTTGQKSGKALLDEFSATIGRNSPRSLDTFSRSLDKMFRDTGTKGGMSLLGGLDQVIGGSGGFGRIVGDFEKLGQDAAEKFVGPKVKGTNGFWGALTGGVKDLGQAVEKIVSTGFTQGLETSTEVETAFGKALSSLPPEAQVPIVTGLAAAVAAGAPMIGAAFTGAILGGVGVVGIGAGIAAQLRDPAVKAAGSDLGKTLLDDLQAASSGFAPILIHGADELKGVLASSLPEIKAGFDALAPGLDDLISGFGGMVHELAPGIRAAFEGAAPVLSAIGAELPRLGGAISIFFKELDDGSSGGATALGDLFKVVEVGTVLLGAFLDLLSKTYGVLRDISTNDWTRLGMDIMSWGQHSKTTSGDVSQLDATLKALSGDAGSTSGVLAGLNHQLGIFDTTAMDSKMASVQFKDSLDAMSQSLKQNKFDFSEDTAAGRANLEAYSRVESQARSLAQGVLDSGGSAIQAAKAYQHNIDALDAMLKKAGMTDQAISRLNASLDAAVRYRKGSVEIDVYVKGNTAYLENQGTTLIVGTGRSMKRMGGIESYAQGGLSAGVYSGGTRSLVKFAEPETGGEAYIPRNGDPARNLRTLAVAAGWNGARIVPAMASTGTGGRGSSGSERPILVQLSLDSRVVLEQLIPVAQQRKQRTGGTGLA